MIESIIPAIAGTQCDSGLRAPQSLHEGDWAYGVTACGFVARALWEATVYRGSSELRDAMDAHYRQVHPERWREMQISRSMSRD